MKYLKNIIEKEKELFNKILKKPTSLKILSLVIAFIFFIAINGLGALSIGNVFEKTEYIDGIELKVVHDQNKIVSGLPQTIGVNIRGSKSNLTKFKANQSSVIATINLSGRSDAEYIIENNEVEFSNSYGVDIEPVIKKFECDLDTITEVQMPVEIEYINSDLEKSIILDDPIINPTNIKFSIGMKNKNNISSVKVILDLADIDTNKTEGKHTYSEQIKVYDKQGDVLNTNTQLPTVEVVQSYSVNKVTLPVKYQIINNDTSKYVSLVCKNVVKNNNVCVDEVQVYGDSDIIEDMTYLNYTVDMAQYDDKKNILTAFPVLPQGVYISGEQSYEVYIELEEGSTKKIKNLPITIQNLDPSLEVINIDNINIDVTITGAKSVIDAMTSSNITLYLDASEIIKPSTYELPIETNISSTIDYELSKNTVNVEFKEK